MEDKTICRIGRKASCQLAGCEFARVGEVHCDNYRTEFISPRIKPISGIRKFIYKRDGFKCLKCGAKKSLTLDEIVPRSKGGKRNRENCQTLCSKCNGEKGNRIIDYRKNSARNWSVGNKIRYTIDSPSSSLHGKSYTVEISAILKDQNSYGVYADYGLDIVPFDKCELIL